MGGPAAISGFDFQARAAAFVAVHILAEHKLSWFPLDWSDVPLAIEAETGSAGDDFVIRLDNSRSYDCQAKETITGKSQLLVALTPFAVAGRRPSTRAVLVIGPKSAGTVREQLKTDLEKARRKSSDPPGPHYNAVCNLFSERGSRDLNLDLAVVSLHLGSPSEAHETVAVSLLNGLLEDPSQADAVWALLIQDAFVMARDRGVADRNFFVGFLSAKGYPVRTALSGGQSPLAQIMARLDSMAVVATPTTGAPGGDGPAAQPLLVSTRGLIAQRRPDAALALLDASAVQIAEMKEADQLAAKNLRAASLIVLGNHDAASAILTELLAVVPEDPMALANSALVALEQSDLARASQLAQRVTELSPSTIGAWVVLAQASPKARIPDDIANHPDVRAAKAMAMLRQGQTLDALTAMQGVVASHPSPERRVGLARIHLAAASEYPAESRTHASTASALAAGILRDLDTSATLPLRRETLLVSAQAAILLDDRTGARRALEQASSGEPVYLPAVFLHALFTMGSGEPSHALQAMDALPESRRTLPLRLLRVMALSATGDGALAREEFDRLDEPADSEGGSAFEMFVEAGIAVSATHRCNAYLDRLAARDRSSSALLRARVLESSRDYEGADQCYAEALTSVAAPDRVRVIAAWAQSLIGRNDAAKAIEFLKSRDALNEPLLQPVLARALFEKRSLSEASRLLAKLTAPDMQQPDWALKLGCLVANMRDDLATLVRLLTVLWERHGRASYGIRLVDTYIRTGSRDAALTIVQKLSAGGSLAAEERLTLAASLVRLGLLSEARRNAFEALVDAPHSLTVQMGYMDIMMRHAPPTEVHDPETVGPNTGAVLKGTDGDETILFFADDPKLAFLNPIPTRLPLAATFFGMHVGDKYVLREGTHTEEHVTVKAIWPPEGVAQYRILRDFKSQHPDETAIQAFPAPNPESDPTLGVIGEQLKDSNEAETDLITSYRDSGLPLGFIATVARKTLPQAILMVASREESSYLVEFGDAAEKSVAAARSDRPVVLTRSGLLMATVFSLRHLLLFASRRILASQSLLDELEHEITELRPFVDKGYHGLGWSDGRPVMHSVPPDRIQRDIELIRDQIAWVRTHAAIEPLPLSIETPEAQQWRERLGESSSDALLLCDTHGAELHADDLGLRRLGLSQFGRYGFSTYALAVAAESDGRIVPDELERVTVQAVAWNQETIPIRPATLLHALRAEGFLIRSSAAAIIARLRRMRPQLDQLLMYTVGTLRAIALEPGGRSHLSFLAYSLLEAVVPQIEASRDRARLRALIAYALRFLPQEQDVCVTALSRVEAAHDNQGTSLL